MSVLKEKPIYFIVGAGRSGSTLLQLILDAHANTIAPVESRFIIFLHAKYAHKKKWGRKQLEQFYQDLFLDEKIELLWELDQSKLKKEILSQREHTDFATLCRLVYENYQSFFEKGKAQIIIDKNPINSLFIPQLAELFPEAKFIHLVRDPRASCRSNTKSSMQPNNVAAALMWETYNKTIERHKAKHSERYLTLFYENLVTEPKRTLQELTHFMGITFENEMLQFNTRLKSGYLEKLSANQNDENKLKLQLIKKYHKNLQKPISAAGVDKWKTDLSKNEIAKIEKICLPLMRNYGYAASSNNDNIKRTSFIENLKHGFKNYIIKFYYASPISLRVWYTNLNSPLKPKLFYGMSDERKAKT